MKVTKITKPLICDTVLCNNLSTYQIDTGSFKGYMYLCPNCFKSLQSILKKEQLKNEKN